MQTVTRGVVSGRGRGFVISMHDLVAVEPRFHPVIRPVVVIRGRGEHATDEHHHRAEQRPSRVANHCRPDKEYRLPPVI